MRSIDVLNSRDLTATTDDDTRVSITFDPVQRLIKAKTFKMPLAFMFKDINYRTSISM